MDRLKFIDGLRGLAILLVVLYHAYSRWPIYVPYHDAYSSIFLFRFGWLGVNLFFIISGFVILMSLERSKNFFDFISKRWLRLFPAMFIVSIIIYLSSFYFFERPAGVPKYYEMLPGLLFIEPSWLSRISPISFGVFEGAFWSIFVEMKFYIIFASLYFLLSKIKAIAILFLLFLAYLILVNCDSLMNLQVFLYLKNYLFELSALYYGWFSTGSLLYLYHTTKKDKYFYLAGFTGLVSIFSLGNENYLPALIILLIAFGSIRSLRIKQFLENRFILFLGFISYPLYLIHENLMISMITKLSVFTFFPDFLLPIISLVFISILSFYIAKKFEPELKNMLLALKGK